MLIYDFLRKVQSEQHNARETAQKEEAMGNRHRASQQRTRAATLYQVLKWAGFEDCDIATKRETP